MPANIINLMLNIYCEWHIREEFHERKRLLPRSKRVFLMRKRHDIKISRAIPLSPTILLSPLPLICSWCCHWRKSLGTECSSSVPCVSFNRATHQIVTAVILSCIYLISIMKYLLFPFLESKRKNAC